MDKKGIKTGNGILILLGIVAVGALIWIGVGMREQAAIAPQQALTEGGLANGIGVVSCPDTGITTGAVRYQNTLASTLTYGDPSCYFVPLTNGQERKTSGALLTTGAYSATVNLQCITSGTKWRVECASDRDNFSSAVETADFTASGSFVERDVQGKRFDELKIKVEDKVTGGAKFFNITGASPVPAAGAYTPLDNNQMNISNEGGSTGSSLTIGADDFIDATIYVKTNTTKRQFGEDGLRTFFLVDANADEWDEPIVTRDNGPELTSVLTELQPDDIKKYTGYEYVYDVGPFTGRESEIDFFLATAAGVNPSTDPLFEFCSEGRYDSSKVQDTLKVGCWSDAATQLQVTGSKRQYAAFSVD